ncbi:MAG TPA: UDP-N-acetylmuramate:L-alanyl-gamma-D-glutamyl-meso-diaminopimelate ligase [Candidatus Hydrogenedens sp.]|nr:UDP-N-acetylmuramate:L-alanyl-gamma-D-glutamyl-meso-diaminopimelate ligase [Candidatus Hydrogenedens sp.]
MAKIHFSGIGGTAMIGGAYIAKQLGHEVRGSDNPLYPPTSILAKKLNVPIYEGYRSTNLEWNPDYVIIGNVLSRKNEEVETILNKAMTYYSLPEWLKYNLLFKRKPIVVSGTHGKTTTTSLISWILRYAGYDPGFLIGGFPINFEIPAYSGKEGSYFVIEGDEYDTAFFDKRAKFLHYLPQILVVTSLEYDHSDIYNSLQEIEKTFQLLLRIVPSQGQVILCNDNHSRMLKQHCFSSYQLYGTSDDSDWQVKTEIYSEKSIMKLYIFYKNKEFCVLRTKLFGLYNALNILCAVSVAHTIGVPISGIVDGIEEFRGVRRRQEVFLEVEDRIYIDDFAHHPTAIQETLKAIRAKYPNKYIVAIFEPRSNTTVTNIFQNEIAESLSISDEIWITPIYREEKIPIEKRLNKEELIKTLTDKGKISKLVKDFDEIFDYLISDVKSNSVIVLLSNGACGNIRERLVAHYR